ncbi:DUF6933 domain-containing protein [Carboxylicivirga caseinilyticus]|uniref:DUF6933 domain-containing protein n=1 Tax=Carboxylicivirga caseinilyticus TaxID=3417572 RepID=UPI003D35794D|nr:hypothetical protein [Marinilabiliaceae bacterium A049]
MKRIYCTKNLGEFIGSVDNILPVDNKDLKANDWNAHIFTLDRKKCLIFVHALTHYTIFIEKFKKGDLKNIDEIFQSKLKQQLDRDELIYGNNFLEKIHFGQELKFYKTNNNRKVLGRLNDFVNIFKYHCKDKYGNIDNMDFIKENGIINKVSIELTQENTKYWTKPFEEMKKLIKTCA